MFFFGKWALKKTLFEFHTSKFADPLPPIVHTCCEFFLLFFWWLPYVKTTFLTIFRCQFEALRVFFETPPAWFFYLHRLNRGTNLYVQCNFVCQTLSIVRSNLVFRKWPTGILIFPQKTERIHWAIPIFAFWTFKISF